MKYLITSLLLFFFIGCNKEKTNDNNISSKEVLSHKIIKSDIEEFGYKIRYEVQLVLTTQQDINQEELKELLESYYYSTIQNEKNKFTREPNFIDIKVYKNEDHLNSKMAQWMGWLSKKPNNKEPLIEFNLNKQVLKENLVSRLEKDTRIEIWKTLIKSQDKAEYEAKKHYPNIKTNKDSNLMYEDEDKLNNEYRKKILKNFKITEEELLKITNEASNENWPFPIRE